MPDNAPFPQFQQQVYDRNIAAGVPGYIADLRARSAQQTQYNIPGQQRGNRNTLQSLAAVPGSVIRGVVGGTGGIAESAGIQASIPFDQTGNTEARNRALRASQAIGNAFAPFQPDMHEQKRWTPEWVGYVGGSVLPSIVGAGATAIAGTAAAAPLGPVAAPIAGAIGAGQVLGHLEAAPSYYDARLEGLTPAQSAAVFHLKGVGTGLLETGTAGRGSKLLKAADIREIIAEGGLKRTLKSGAKEGVSEAREEFLQGRWQNAVGSLAGIEKWEDSLNSWPEEIVGGLLGGGGMGMVTTMMENKGIEKFLNTNMEIKLGTDQEGKKVVTEVNPTSDKPTDKAEDVSAGISRIVIGADLTKAMFSGTPIEQGQAEGDFSVTKTSPDGEGLITEKAKYTRPSVANNIASRRVLEKLFDGAEIDHGGLPLKIRKDGGSEFFNELDPIQQLRMQNEVLAYAKTFNVKVDKLTDQQFSELRNHILKTNNQDNTVYYTRKGERSAGPETLVNYRGRAVELEKLPAILQQTNTLPEELEFVAAELEGQDDLISRQLGDVLLREAKASNINWNQVAVNKIPELHRKINSKTVKPVDPMLDMYDSAGVKPTATQLKNRQGQVNTLLHYHQTGTNKDQIEQKLREWFSPKRRTRKSTKAKVVKQAHKTKKAADAIKNPENLKELRSNQEKAKKQDKAKGKKTVKQIKTVVGLPVQMGIAGTLTQFTAKQVEFLRKQILSNEKLVNDIPIYFNEFPKEARELLDRKGEKDNVRTAFFRHPNPVKAQDNFINVNLVDAEKAYQRYQDTGNLYRDGYAQPGQGLNKSEVMAMVIEHERIHAATGLTSQYKAQDNLVTALALERIGRPDIAKTIYEQMAKSGEQLGPISEQFMPVNKAKHDAGVSSMSKLKAKTVEVDNNKPSRVVQDVVNNPLNKKELTALEQGMGVLKDILKDYGYQDLSDAQMNVFTRNLADFFNKDVTLDELRNGGVDQDVISSFDSLKNNLSKKEAKFVIEYLTKLNDYLETREQDYRARNKKDPNDPSKVYSDLERGLLTFIGQYDVDNVTQLSKAVVNWVAEGSANFAELAGLVGGLADSSPELVSDISNYVANFMNKRDRELNDNKHRYVELQNMVHDFSTSWQKSLELATRRFAKWKVGEPFESKLSQPFYSTIARMVMGRGIKFKGAIGGNTSWRRASNSKVKAIQELGHLGEGSDTGQNWIFDTVDHLPKPYSIIKFSPTASSKNNALFLVTNSERVTLNGEKGWKMHGFRIDPDLLLERMGKPAAVVESFKDLPEGGRNTKTYAGIGSRKLPKAIRTEIQLVAKELSELGYTLRTGDATGSDAAFRASHLGKKEVFTAKDATNVTRSIAKEVHPSPGNLTTYALNLMARNTNQVFGEKLNSPVDFVLAYTPGGEETAKQRTRDTGGTGQAIAMASRKKIPVINLAKKGWREKLYKIIEGVDASGEQVSVKEAEIKRQKISFELYNAYREQMRQGEGMPQAIDVFKRMTQDYINGKMNSEAYVDLLSGLSNFKMDLIGVNVPYARDPKLADALKAAYLGSNGSYALDYRGLKEGAKPVSHWTFRFNNKEDAISFKEIADQAYAQLGYFQQDPSQHDDRVTNALLGETNNHYLDLEKKYEGDVDSHFARGYITELQAQNLRLALKAKAWSDSYFEMPEAEKLDEKLQAEYIPLNVHTEAKDAPTLELGQFSLKMKLLYKGHQFMNLWDTNNYLKKFFTSDEMKKYYKWPTNLEKKQDIVSKEKQVEARIGQHHTMIGTILSEKISRYFLDWRMKQVDDDGTQYNEEQAKGWWNAKDNEGETASQLLAMAAEEIDVDPTKDGNMFFYTNIGDGFLWETTEQRDATIDKARKLYKVFGQEQHFDPKQYANGRPKGATFNILPVEIQNFLIWQKKLINIMGDARVRNGFMEDVNFLGHKLDGYFPRISFKELEQRGGGGQAGLGAFASTYEPARQHRTYPEYAAQVLSSRLELVGIDSVMGNYVKSSLDYFLMKQMREEYLRMPIDPELRKQFNIPDNQVFNVITYDNDIQRYVDQLPKSEKEAWMYKHGQEAEVFAQFDRYQGVTDKVVKKPNIKAVMTAMGYREFKSAPGLARYIYRTQKQTDDQGGQAGWGKDYPWVHSSIYKLLESLHEDKTVDALTKKVVRFNSLIKRWVMHNPYLYLWNIIAMPALHMAIHGRGKDVYQHIIKPLPKVTPKEFWIGGAAGAMLAGVATVALGGAPILGAGVTGPLGFQLGSWAGLGSTKRAERIKKGLDDSYDFLKSYTDDELYELNEAIINGLNAGNTGWMMRSMYHETALDKEKPLNLSEAGLLGRFFDTKAGMDHDVFSKYVTRVLFETYKSFRDGFLAKGQDPETARRLAASMANNFGGTLQGNLYGKFENYARLWQFATDFQDTFFRMVTGASYPVWKKMWGYKPGGINVVFHGEARQKEMEASWKEYAKLLSQAFFTKFLTVSLISYALSFFDDDDEQHGKGNLDFDYFTGDSVDMFHNEPGLEMSIRTPLKDEFGNTLYIDPVLLREPNQLMELFYSKMRKDYSLMPQRVVRNLAPFFGDYWDGKESAFFQAMRDLKTKQDFFGQPIAEDPTDVGALMGWTKAAAKVGLPLYARTDFSAPSGDPLTQGVTRFAASVGFSTKKGKFSTNSPFKYQMDAREALQNHFFNQTKMRQQMRNATDRELLDAFYSGKINKQQLENMRISRRSDAALRSRVSSNRQNFLKEYFKLQS